MPIRLSRVKIAWLSVSPVPFEPDHQPVAHQHVVADAFEIDDVLDARHRCAWRGGPKDQRDGAKRECGEAGEAFDDGHEYRSSKPMGSGLPHARPVPRPKSLSMARKSGIAGAGRERQYVPPGAASFAAALKRLLTLCLRCFGAMRIEWTPPLRAAISASRRRGHGSRSILQPLVLGGERRRAGRAHRDRRDAGGRRAAVAPGNVRRPGRTAPRRWRAARSCSMRSTSCAMRSSRRRCRARSLAALARLAGETAPLVDDPRLAEILAEIELRAAVELAKLGDMPRSRRRALSSRLRSATPIHILAARFELALWEW